MSVCVCVLVYVYNIRACSSQNIGDTPFFFGSRQLHAKFNARHFCSNLFNIYSHIGLIRIVCVCSAYKW